MPSADESQESRQTYGNAPGWAMTEKSETPAGAPETSPTPDAPAAPSAEETSQEQVSEQAPPPTSQPEPEKKFNMPPEERWEELRQQKAEAERRASEAQQLAQLALQRLQVPQAVVPQEDPWNGKVNHPDPATAQFYQEQRRLVEITAQQIAQGQMQGLYQAVDAGRKEIARLNAKEFRKENPDIKPGSPEENLVAAYMSGQMDGVQHTIESARKNAMYDKLEAENRALKSKQSTIPQKRAAAQAEPSSGIPSTAGLPGKPGDWREKAGEVLDKGGSVKDVLHLVFGGGR